MGTSNLGFLFVAKQYRTSKYYNGKLSHFSALFDKPKSLS
jgi:hypothetical protein